MTDLERRLIEATKAAKLLIEEYSEPWAPWFDERSFPAPRYEPSDIGEKR